MHSHALHQEGFRALPSGAVITSLNPFPKIAHRCAAFGKGAGFGGRPELREDFQSEDWAKRDRQTVQQVGTLKGRAALQSGGDCARSQTSRPTGPVKRTETDAELIRN